MSKYEDDAMELIEMVAENSHHNAAKPFGRGAMPKAIYAKSTETGMLLERIDKMAEVQNLLLDRLYIRNGSEGLAPISLQEASPCATCLRFDHVELDCHVMGIQGQGMYRQGPSRGPNQQGRPNYPGNYPNQYITLFLTILHRITDIGGTTINPILHNITVSNPNLIKDNRRSSRRLNHKHTRKLHAGIRPNPRHDLTTNGANDEDGLTRGRNSRLLQDERPTDDG